MTEAAAVRFINENVQVGQGEQHALRLLRSRAFRCRTLGPDEYTRPSPESVKLVSCYTQVDRNESGYRLVYVNLGLDGDQRVTTSTAGS